MVMALIKFYRHGDIWHLGQYDAVPAGFWSRTFDENGKMLIQLFPPSSDAPNGNIYARGSYSDFCDENGDAYATQEAFDGATDDFFVEALQEGVPKIFLSSVNTKSITGTTEQSAIPTIYRGTPIIHKHFWLKDGAILHLIGFTTLSTGISQSSTLKVKIGATEVVSSTELLPNNLNDMAVYFNAYIIYIGNGKTRLSGYTLTQTAQGLASPVYRRLISNDVAIDTTIDQAIDIRYKFSGAGNTLIIRMIEAIKY